MYLDLANNITSYTKGFLVFSIPKTDGVQVFQFLYFILDRLT